MTCPQLVVFWCRWIDLAYFYSRSSTNAFKFRSKIVEDNLCPLCPVGVNYPVHMEIEVGSPRSLMKSTYKMMAR